MYNESSKNIRTNLDILIIIGILTIVLLKLNIKIIDLFGSVIILLVIPGYLLCTLFFPISNLNSVFFRILLSVGSSVVISSLMFLLLSYSIGINYNSISNTIILFFAIFCMILIVQRWKLKLPGISISTFRIAHVLPNSPLGVLKWSSILAVIVCFSFYLKLTNDNQPAYTEFYILGEDGFFENFTKQIKQSGKLDITIEISNKEGKDCDYSIIALIGDLKVGSIESITIKEGEIFQGILPITNLLPGKNQPIDIILFKENTSSLYRSLRYWIDVTGN